MRILVFSHYYPPEVNAPASRISEHCWAWAKMGHDVTVVTCAPNHPSGRVYPDYRNRLFQVDTIDGVRVIRLWTFLSANEGHFLRTLNYLSYLVSVVIALPRLPRADVFLSTSPQFFCGLSPLAVRIFRRTPWVLEIRDLWPESIVTVGAMHRGVAIRFLEWLESLAYRRADAIVSVTNSFVEHIADRCGNSDKITVIPNGVDFNQFRKPAPGRTLKSQLGLEGRFVASYVGTHGMAHGLGTLLEAAEHLRDDPRIIFLLVGDGAERAKLEALKAKKCLDNVVILGQRPKSDMPEIWAATDVSLVMLRRSDAFKRVLPSKMFEAMAMGCPIILGVEGEACELLNEAQAGIPITPESASELAAAILHLATEREAAALYGARGSAYVRAHFDRQKLAEHYIRVLNAVAAGRSLPKLASAYASRLAAKRP